MLISSLQETTSTEVVSALGAIECPGKPGIMQLLIEEEDKVLELAEALWLPLEAKLKSLPFYLKVKLSGKRVLEAEAVEGEVAEE